MKGENWKAEPNGPRKWTHVLIVRLGKGTAFLKIAVSAIAIYRDAYCRWTANASCMHVHGGIPEREQSESPTSEAEQHNDQPPSQLTYFLELYEFIVPGQV